MLISSLWCFCLTSRKKWQFLPSLWLFHAAACSRVVLKELFGCQIKVLQLVWTAQGARTPPPPASHYKLGLQESHLCHTHTHKSLRIMSFMWYKWLWPCLLPTTGLIPRSFWCSCLWIIKHEGVTFAFKREVATGCQFSFTAEQVEQPSAPLMLTKSHCSPLSKNN